MEKIKIINGRLITPYRIIDQGSILIEEGKITAINQNDQEHAGVHIIDARHQYVAPGFIDIHVHGGGGHDFMDGTVEAFLGAAKLHARHGTTSMVPTTLTAEAEDLIRTFKMYDIAKKENHQGSEFLGLHIEGPYFAMNQKGAQDPRYIRLPRRVEYEEILKHTSDIMRWSAAPELEGAMEFARYIQTKNILPCIAHSDATSEEVVLALEQGFTHVTHLYSAMSGVMRRHA